MSAPERPIWCLTCQIHLAKPTDGLCPVCLDSRQKAADTRHDTAPTANVDARLSPERVTYIPASAEAQQ